MLYFDMGMLKQSASAGGFLYGPELKRVLRDLSKELQEGPEGGFFGGKHPGRADILFEYPISMATHREWVDLKEFPLINAWLDRVYQRDAWKRALEKGNGYDLRIFPKSSKL